VLPVLRPQQREIEQNVGLLQTYMTGAIFVQYVPWRPQMLCCLRNVIAFSISPFPWSRIPSYLFYLFFTLFVSVGKRSRIRTDWALCTSEDITDASVLFAQNRGNKVFRFHSLSS
jgi:hypothetical protein